MPENSGDKALSSRSGGVTSRRWSYMLRPALVFLVYSVGYLTLDAATEGLKGSLSFSLWFPPAGLTFALLLIFGARYALAVAPVFLLHLILFRDGMSYPGAILFAITASYTVLYAGAAALLVKVLKIDPRLARMRDVAWFLGVACFSAPLLAGAAVVPGAILARYVPSDAFWENILAFWAGDATGIGVLGAFLLVASRPSASLWKQRPRGPAVKGFQLPSRRELPEVGLQVLALALSLAVAYGGARGASLDYAYIAFAPLVWIALRGGFQRATLAVLLINIGVVILVGGVTDDANPIFLQFGLMALTLLGLLLGALASERDRADEALEESEQRFRSVVHNSSEAITILDPDGTVRYVSPAFKWLFGYEPAEMVGENINDYIHPEDFPRVAQGSEKALAESGVTRNVAEHRLRHKDGSWRYVETTGTYLLDDPAVRGVVVNARDVTVRREAEEALRESEERFRTAFEDSPIGVALVGLDMRYLRVNQELCEMLGYPEEAMLEKTVSEVVHPDDHEISVEYVRQAIEEGLGSYTLERRYIRSDGRVAWNLTSVSLIRDSEDEPSHFVCLHQDITGRKELEERLEHQAFHDALTGLPNRALLLDRLKQALARTERRAGGRGVALLFLDLDDFKTVNDSLGHEAGDGLLVEAAHRLERLARLEDTVARLGGDEFCVLLEDVEAEEAARVAGRILAELGGAPFLLDEVGGEGQKHVFTTTSVGIALSRTHHSPSDLLKEADLAMYRAKEEGKGRYAFFEPHLLEGAKERAKLEGDLRRAIEHEEFELYYQPKVCLRTGRILWMEALLRWEHPERGLLRPAEFIPLAEETGLTVQIGLRVLEEALQQGRRWREQQNRATRKTEDRPRPPGVCVNLSARQLSEERLVEEIRELLARNGTAPRDFGIEVTESVLMKAERTSSALEELREMGITILLDDFGTGYSSLSYLKNFPAHLLKIDCSFVEGLGENPEEEAIVSSMVSLAHATGKQVIAECVENSRQLALLTEMGCEMGQGNYLSEPLPAGAAARLVQDYNPEGFLPGHLGEPGITS